uniref:PARP-type domain-containing protein n=1 Tax=Lotharella oceanica TaxID=641309 RepID=A0A7S2TQT0_9EUKA|mmetsp:Transcript_25301/g.47212  ORF Transcript_25301/g.47212 Transcript_25301/m.47212 type:complete len:122 (+) Transcript_25301:216-581(+)
MPATTKTGLHLSVGLDGKRGGAKASLAESQYWQHRYRPCVARDLGHTCRECKRPLTKIGETIAIRRGGRIEMRYHEACFSGESDPRTQKKASHKQGKWVRCVAGTKAPLGKYKKMRTTSHW